MIDAAAVQEIIALYSKHGWTLRRVLLSERLRSSLSPDTLQMFSSAVIEDSRLDAAWFSRSSQAGRTAWEIRHLSETPFAFVVVIDDGSDDEQAEELRRDAEERMMETTTSRERAN